MELKITTLISLLSFHCNNFNISIAAKLLDWEMREVQQVLRHVTVLRVKYSKYSDTSQCYVLGNCRLPNLLDFNKDEIFLVRCYTSLSSVNSKAGFINSTQHISPYIARRTTTCSQIILQVWSEHTLENRLSKFPGALWTKACLLLSTNGTDLITAC